LTRGYREFEPPPALRPFVSCFWARSAGGAGASTQTRVLPDGAVDIILDLGAERAEESAYVVGTMTRPLLVTPRHGSDFLAVRFRPGAAHGLLGFPIHEMTDRREHLGAIWSGVDELVVRIREQRTFDGRLGLFAGILARRAVESAAAPEPRVIEATRTIRAAGGVVSVEELSQSLGVSRQHLTRLFERHVGVGVKFFSRVVRLQAVLGAISSAEGKRGELRWAALALDHGFFDQAHLVADFRALTGLTPVQFKMQ
jgi:AraC-like DNA-binding protein